MSPHTHRQEYNIFSRELSLLHYSTRHAFTTHNDFAAFFASALYWPAFTQIPTRHDLATLLISPQYRHIRGYRRLMLLISSTTRLFYFSLHTLA
jgi:hypothetical protein